MSASSTTTATVTLTAEEWGLIARAVASARDSRLACGFYGLSRRYGLALAALVTELEALGVDVEVDE